MKTYGNVSLHVQTDTLNKFSRHNKDVYRLVLQCLDLIQLDSVYLHVPIHGLLILLVKCVNNNAQITILTIKLHLLVGTEHVKLGAKPINGQILLQKYVIEILLQTVQLDIMLMTIPTFVKKVNLL